MRRGWRTGALVGLLAAGVLGVPAPGRAQEPQPPLRATLFFIGAPADFTYDPSVPIKLGLKVENVKGVPVVTTEGFSGSDFWRRLYFTDPQGGIVTNTSEAAIHGDTRLGFCLSRLGALQRPTAIPVVPVEVLPQSPQPFLLEYTIDEARQFYDLTRPGRYTVEARIPFLEVLGADAIIQDCDQFPGTALVDVGAGAALSRQGFTIVSNPLQFTVRSPDATPPVTTVSVSPLPNAAGWNRSDATVTFNATDEEGGAGGVSQINVSMAGAQSGGLVLPGSAGEATVSAQGLTTLTYSAQDQAGNVESPKLLDVRLDRGAPVLSLAPPSAVFLLNQPIVVTFGATDAVSGLVALPSGTVTPPGQPAMAIASPSSVTLNRVRDWVARASARDVAGNEAQRQATYTVRYRFVGFGGQVGSETACASSPCGTFAGRGVIPVRFQLFDFAAQVVSTAVATISVAQLSGTPVPPPTNLGTGGSAGSNQFRFDASAGQYVFNLNGRVLAPGVWRIDAHLDDGTTHSAQIRLR